jgi:hypothetical protein
VDLYDREMTTSLRRQGVRPTSAAGLGVDGGSARAVPGDSARRRRCGGTVPGAPAPRIVRTSLLVAAWAWS